LDLNFSTIEVLAEYFIDFLILEALHMDANRNFNHYIDERSEKINYHLGDPNWRIEWENSGYLSKDFVKFLAFEYDKKMSDLGYLPAHRHQIKLPVKNVPLYYLTFYSKHERGLDFFKKVNDYATPQLSLGV